MWKKGEGEKVLRKVVENFQEYVDFKIVKFYAKAFSMFENVIKDESSFQIKFYFIVLFHGVMLSG